ncbi:hypothetical protein DY218_19535 [Streptomyces triticagri]|uniref:Uncharacterized protein n=2 Tax=Streptomyces triticagri TaxID=2293568 RepID=A0A372M3Z5_9ACTN|nr:hypothetical protein DY218_19535 [Streptomyces triticagri]
MPRRTVVATAVAAPLLATALPSRARARDARTDPARRPATVSDTLRLGVPASERRHRLVERAGSRAVTGTVEQGTLVERYSARAVTRGGGFTATLAVTPGEPLTLHFGELRPDDTWGAAFGFEVHLGDTLVYVRDSAQADPGGGPYGSFFVETDDPEVTAAGEIEVTVRGTTREPAYFRHIRAFADLDRMVREQGLRVQDRIVFVLGQDYRPDSESRAKLDYITEQFRDTDDVAFGLAVLDYFPRRTAGEMAANYAKWLDFSRTYELPFAIEGHADWEGTPLDEPDGSGGTFGDLKYHQILWSPQHLLDRPMDSYRGESLDELLGTDHDRRYGLSVPNPWGMPWLTWHNATLNDHYRRKAAESMAQVRPLLWRLQRTGEAGRLLPFSTATESVYWSHRGTEGVWDDTYRDEINGGVARTDLFADYSPDAVAAAAKDGVVLDGATPLNAAEKRWLWRAQSVHQQLFADAWYHGLPRERIVVGPEGAVFPRDLLRHNIHSEIYSRLQEPYYSSVRPSSAQGVVRHGRPGAQYISLGDHTVGGFWHLQRLREFGRLANPNLEDSVSFDPSDKTLILRQTFVNGSRYTSPYNWQRAADADPAENEATRWINPFLATLHPWDVQNDAAPTAVLRGRRRVHQTFSAGELGLLNDVRVRARRTGAAAALRCA